jgi:hypothetical protein
MIDERTGRPIGDHGSAIDAIDFALHGIVPVPDGPGALDFLRDWRSGDAADEWPGYFTWLEHHHAPPAEAPGIGRTELTGGEDA